MRGLKRFALEHMALTIVESSTPCIYYHYLSKFTSRAPLGDVHPRRNGGETSVVTCPAESLRASVARPARPVPAVSRGCREGFVWTTSTGSQKGFGDRCVRNGLKPQKRTEQLSKLLPHAAHKDSFLVNI